MPQINRIRIINFSYNNNHRNIVDETFEFFQGENALLSLKNGGGKSVLVQLLLQPILPKTRLMGRRIEDFFKGKKTPAYVLVEWKLEDQGGYLLTGIALSNRETIAREQEDAQNAIKYFTFTSHYRESNPFDLSSIPLVKQEKDRLFIEDFKDARKIISAKKQDSKFQVKVFSDDEGREYKSHLESYNIFPDEWKSIVLKINESEGGVIEIFEKCKTSLQLLNDWILRSVEKVVNKDEEDQKKLEDMLENLVGEMIANEQFIYEKDLYEAFLRKSEEFLGELNKLTDSLDKENKLEREMASLFYFLKSEVIEMRKEITLQNEVINESNRELEKIELEERSKDYYDVLERVESLSESLNEEKGKLDSVREKLVFEKYQETLQLAARDYRSVRVLLTRIEGIRTDIETLKSGSTNKEDIRKLEYSLKLAYEKLLDELLWKSEELERKMKQTVQEIANCDQKLAKLDARNSHHRQEVGTLTSRIEQFEKEESRLVDQLGLTFERNLLGEIEPIYFERYFNGLENETSELEIEKGNRIQEIESLEMQSAEAKEKRAELRHELDDQKVLLSRVNLEIEDYQQLENSLKPIFERYDLDFARRFLHQENHLYFKKVIQDLEKRERDLQFDIHMQKETMESLRTGTLHTSKEFRQWLENHDIDYKTGENYLREQEASIRETLLSQNPILPYAFLLYDEDIEKVSTMDIDMNIQQVIPILSYQQINQSLKTKGKAVQIADKLQFLSLYDSRMFHVNDLEEYEGELRRELNEWNEQLKHCRIELDSAREDEQVLKRFTHGENDRYILENKKSDCEKAIKKYSSHIAELESNLESFSARITNNRLRIKEIEDLLLKLADRRNKAEEFIVANDEYIQNQQDLAKFQAEIMSIDKGKKQIAAMKSELSILKDTLIVEDSDHKKKVKDTREKFALYQHAEVAEVLEQEMDVMEAKLHHLKREITDRLERLEEDLEEKERELAEKKASLDSYQLAEAEYKGIEFDPDKLLVLQKGIKELAEQEKRIDEKYRQLDRDLSGARGEFAAAEREVKKLADEPIDRSQIKLNFKERRRVEDNRQKDASKKINSLNKKTTDYEKLVTRIDGQINPAKYEFNSAYKVQNGVHEDFSELNKELSFAKNENRQYETNVYKKYSDLKGSFGGKNKIIDDILIGFDAKLEDAKSDRLKYYHLGERIIDNQRSLDHLIKVYSQRLANIDKSKNDMIQHSYLHAKQVYEEIQKIADNSSIKLEGKNRPVPMLKIEMEPLSDVTEENTGKIKDYIESRITTIKNDMKDGKHIDEIRKKISRYMSTKELLHVLSDLGKLRIYAYKIDINIKNSTYKTWEQVMKENSGGERFVSFFAVIVALMSYTRTSMKYVDDYERNKDTKVLIMDNPFGPISSEHLLRPLFQIAKKYNTQLICLTDLKQNSILNCFNLIYMIKIRQNVFGTNEYIQLEQQIKEDANIQKDERLEKAVFKVEEVEQLSLL